MTTPGIDDPYLPLAFSISSTPRAHALLAGAGISRGANVATAWEVVTELARKVCRARHDDARADALTTENVERWWIDEFKSPLSYSSILEQLGRTQDEREALLSAFFEPAGDPPITSRAHSAVARLVASGHVRVIVTLNFDHLFETALTAEGIDPVIVRTDADAEGLAPLHTYECVVVHLHGDYRHGASMLNTVDELSGYGPHMSTLLTTVLSNHAIIAVGWSVTYDIALRDEVAAHTSRHHRSAWIDPQPSVAGRDLARSLGASVLEASADDALGRLADIVDTIGRSTARHPLTARVAVDRIKRDLTGEHPAITAHDIFATEYANVSDVLQRYAAPEPDDVAAARQAITDSSGVLCAATATLAYWGTPTTDQWWMTSIIDHADIWVGNGGLEWLELPRSVSVPLFYAAGVAAVAARRYKPLIELFGTTIRNRFNADDEALPRVLGWTSATHHTPSTEVREGLACVIGESLALTQRRVDDAWQEFEVLRLLHQIGTNNQMFGLLGAARNAGDGVGSVDHENRTRRGPDEQQDLTPMLRVFDAANNAAAEFCSPRGFHISTTETPDRYKRMKYQSPAVDRLQKSVTRDDLSPLGQRFHDPSTVRTLFDIARAAIDRASRSRWDRGSKVWLDAPPMKKGVLQ